MGRGEPQDAIEFFTGFVVPNKSGEQNPADKRVSEQEKTIWKMNPGDPHLPAARRLLDRLKKLADAVPRVLDLRRDKDR